MPKNRRYLIVNISLREALEEVATRVFEDSGLNDDHAGDGRFYYVHND